MNLQRREKRNGKFISTFGESFKLCIFVIFAGLAVSIDASSDTNYIASLEIISDHGSAKAIFAGGHERKSLMPTEKLFKTHWHPIGFTKRR